MLHLARVTEHDVSSANSPAGNVRVALTSLMAARRQGALLPDYTVLALSVKNVSVKYRGVARLLPARFWRARNNQFRQVRDIDAPIPEEKRVIVTNQLLLSRRERRHRNSLSAYVVLNLNHDSLV